MDVNELHVRDDFSMIKRRSEVKEKFGSKIKSRTFALPFEKRVAEQAESSTKDWRDKNF